MMLSPPMDTTCTGTFAPSVKLVAHLLVSCVASNVHVPRTVSLLAGIVFPCHLPLTCAIEMGAAAGALEAFAAAVAAPAGLAALVAVFASRLSDRAQATTVNAHTSTATEVWRVITFPPESGRQTYVWIPNHGREHCRRLLARLYLEKEVYVGGDIGPPHPLGLELPYGR